MIVLDYWFYRTYTLFSSKKRKMDPVIETLSALAGTTVGYIVLILDLLKVDWVGPNLRIIISLAMLFFMGLYFFLFFWRKRYKIIVTRFQSEKRYHRIIGNIIVIFLFALPFVIMSEYHGKLTL